MPTKIKELPELERPYEKLELYGEKMLSNAELLAIIIKTGTKEETSVQIAQKILKLNDENTDELKFLRKTTIEELIQIKGIGRIKAIQIKAMCELSIRMTFPNNYRKIIIREPKDIVQILMEELRIKKREIAKLVILDNKNKVLKITDIAIGGSNLVNISIKDILTEPLKINGPKIIMVHNHPSGDCNPSQADIDFTDRLYEASMIMDIELLDHIVIGDGNYTSIFSEILNKQKTKI